MKRKVGGVDVQKRCIVESSRPRPQPIFPSDPVRRESEIEKEREREMEWGKREGERDRGMEEARKGGRERDIGRHIRRGDFL
jgi:hypothetical protein